MQLYFGIGAWTGWVSGLSRPEELECWADSGVIPDCPTAYPVPDFVPKMQRRRLSELTRLVLSEIEKVPGYQSIPAVFCSRHGDLPKTVKLLEDLAREEPLSPTHFALSVHNAVSGQLSIFSGNEQPTTLVSAGYDSFGCGMIEAIVKMHSENIPRMLLVCADLPLPDPYKGYSDEKQIPYCLVIELLSQGDWSVEVNSLKPGSGEPQQYPAALAFIQGIVKQKTDFLVQGKNKKWRFRHVI